MEAGNQETNAVISEKVRKYCSSIWSLNIPPNIKTFWWRMAHGGIAVLDNLRRRGVKIDNTCPVCEEQMETLNHAFFQCRVAREVWELSPTSFTVLDQSSNGVIQNINEMIRLVQRDQEDILNFFVGWRLWKMRNKWMLHGSLLERRWGLAGPYTEEKAPKSCMDPQQKRL
ncbi:hypothetical protein Bca4012_088160 [Brassica carinata]